MKATDGTRLYSTLPKFENARTWAEIDLGALKENFEYLQGRINLQADEAGIKRPEPICVVKADAYGHGARGVVPTLLASGCRFFAVSSAEEAAEIRNICRIRRYSANILVLGVVPTQLAEVLASYDIITTVPSLEYAKRLSLAAREAGVRGGTIISGRGVAREEEATFFGITIHAEKELLMMVVEKDIRDEVLHALYKQMGMQQKAQGIVFSLPVSDVAGLAPAIEEAEIKDI